MFPGDKKNFQRKRLPVRKPFLIKTRFNKTYDSNEEMNNKDYYVKVAGMSFIKNTIL
jgi:hypothetical protein